MANTPLVMISTYSRERFERLRLSLNGKGLELEGDKGTVERAGAHVDYEFFETTPANHPTSQPKIGTLTVTVIRQPLMRSFYGFCEELRKTIGAQQ